MGTSDRYLRLFDQAHDVAEGKNRENHTRDTQSRSLWTHGRILAARFRFVSKNRSSVLAAQNAFELAPNENRTSSYSHQEQGANAVEVLVIEKCGHSAPECFRDSLRRRVRRRRRKHVECLFYHHLRPDQNLNRPLAGHKLPFIVKAVADIAIAAESAKVFPLLDLAAST